MLRNVLRTLLATALVGLYLFSSALPQAAASESGSAPLFARTAAQFWHGFKEFWIGAFQKQNGIVLAALGLAAISLFIITRSKWKK